MRHKHGEWRRIRCHFSPLFAETGKIDGVIISGRDVTELKRLEEQLIQAEKLAAMGQMLAGVAHELNNPLTAILGVTELLRERTGFDESAKRQLDLTHRQARRAARIVQNLLEFSRPAAPQKKPLDVNSLIERTLQLHEHSLRRNNVEVEFHSQPGLQPVVGDGNQLIQVFLNLITNAEHAIREVRDSGRIQIRLGQLGGHVSVTVQDDGVGIPPESAAPDFRSLLHHQAPRWRHRPGPQHLHVDRARTRRLYRRGDTSRRRLGLHRFSSRVPARAKSAARSRLPRWEPRSARSAPSDNILKGRSVLVLDDEESLRMLLEEGLSVHGLRVDCAATPAEALALVSRRSYDIFLCDLNLTAAGQPADGRQVTKQILAAAGTNQPTVIFMTGELIDPSEPGSSEPRRLQKPFRISDVVALLREILDTTSAVPVEKVRN